MPAQIQPKSFESRWNLFFLPMVDVPYVYVHASALCFNSLISTHTFWKALTVSVDRCAEIECSYSGITNSGRVSRNGSETDARSVLPPLSPSSPKCPSVCNYPPPVLFSSPSHFSFLVHTPHSDIVLRMIQLVTLLFTQLQIIQEETIGF